MDKRYPRRSSFAGQINKLTILFYVRYATGAGIIWKDRNPKQAKEAIGGEAMEQ